MTLGDYGRPLQISKFIRDIHAGFQLLNLKNDALRKRSDAIKYSVSGHLKMSASVQVTKILGVAQQHYG